MEPRRRHTGERAQGAQMWAHRGEGTGSPDAGTLERAQGAGRGHTGKRAHGAQTRAHRGEGTGSPDVGTQGRGHTEPRRRHTGERAKGAQTWAHRGEGTQSPDVGTQGRGHTEPGAQMQARVQGSLCSLPLGLCPEDAFCCVLSQGSCTQGGPLHLELQHHRPVVAFKGRSLYMAAALHGKVYTSTQQPPSARAAPGDPASCPHTSQQPFLHSGAWGRPTPFHVAFRAPTELHPCAPRGDGPLAKAGQATAAALSLCAPQHRLLPSPPIL